MKTLGLMCLSFVVGFLAAAQLYRPMSLWPQEETSLHPQEAGIAPAEVEAPAGQKAELLTGLQRKPSSLEEPERVKLLFNLENIIQLENEWESLQTSIVTNRENEGWRVHFLIQSNLFAELGMQDQDLIRFDYLDYAKKNPSDREVAERFERILVELEE